MMRQFLIPVLLFALVFISCKQSEKLLSRKQATQTLVTEVSALDGQWLIKTVDGEPVNSGEREVYLKFIQAEDRFVGNAGCNSFSGAIEVKNGTINFGHIMATKMYCLNIDLEERLLAMLRESSWSIHLDKDLLKLQNEKHRIQLQKDKR